MSVILTQKNFISHSIALILGAVLYYTYTEFSNTDEATQKIVFSNSTNESDSSHPVATDSVTERERNSQKTFSNIDSLIQQVLDREHAQRLADPIDTLINELTNNPSSRSILIARLSQESDQQKMGVIRYALARTGTPDIANSAIKIASIGSTDERIKGFEMLALMQDQSREARSHIQMSLNTERDPLIIEHLLRTLSPPENQSIEDQSSLLQRIKEFSNNSDARVRGASLLARSRWEGLTVEQEVAAAMSSNDEAMINYCLQAISEGRLRGDSIKQGLFSLATKESASISIRRTATGMLGQFNLNQSEHAQLASLRATLS